MKRAYRVNGGKLQIEPYGNAGHWRVTVWRKSGVSSAWGDYCIHGRAAAWKHGVRILKMKEGRL